MNFKIILLLPPNTHQDWPDRIRSAVSGCDVKLFNKTGDAMEDLADADAVYGSVGPEIFPYAHKLKWIQAPAASPQAGYYHEALVKSPVVVTNMRGIYNEHVGNHAMVLLLALSHHLERYMSQQLNSNWKPLEPSVFLSESTALIIGTGGIGTETARLCASFGIKVIGVDPRINEAPLHVSELHRPCDLDKILGKVDFVIMITPETPETQGLMNSKRFGLMKETAYFINVGRGACVVLADLVEALCSKSIAGAGLDVFEKEPLPPNHPLWTMPNVILTPHIAALEGAHLEERRRHILIENCKRFGSGRTLLNIVDKAKWF